MIHGRIIDDFSIITVDSTTADNHESTLGTGTNDLGNDTRAHTKESTLGTGTNDVGNDTRAHTNLYSGQVDRAFGFFGNSINTGYITATIGSSN